MIFYRTLMIVYQYINIWRVFAGGQTVDKNSIKKERKTIKPFQKTTLKCGGHNLSLAIVLFAPHCPSAVRLGLVSFLKL